jgi:hypothetical protein
VFTKVDLNSFVVMIPNLLEATQDYWRKLNELDAAYQRGEVSLPEVDARVKELMTELGQERRAALRLMFSNLGQFWQEHRELVLGLGLMGALTYAWIAVGTV